MKKVPEKKTVIETQSKQKQPWLATTRAFLEIPNPSILKLFVISSFATLISGIVLAVEWMVHGRSHTGFGWIVYYALFLIFLPLLVCFGIHFWAITCTRDSSSQIVDSIAVKEPSRNDVPEGTEETEKNSCRSLAVVVESDEKKNEKTPRIKRAVSFPSHGKVRSCRTR